MLAWLKRFFNPMCPECARMHAIIAERDASHRSIVESYEARLNSLRDNLGYRDSLSNDVIRRLELEKSEFKDALFLLTRIGGNRVQQPRQPNPEHMQSQDRGLVGSARNWSDVKRHLEHTHRKPTSSADEKANMWDEVNKKAEQEIPELAQALAQKDAQLRSDLDIIEQQD